MRLHYNSQVNVKFRILWIYTPQEFVIGLGLGIAVVIAQEILGIGGNPLESVAVIIAYSVFLAVFKIGRPEGYLEHLIAHFFTPTEFRPGHREQEYPILACSEETYALKVKRSRSELWEDANELQKRLLQRGLAFESVTNNRFFVLSDSEIEEARQYLEGGGLIGIGNVRRPETAFPSKGK